MKHHDSGKKVFISVCISGLVRFLIYATKRLASVTQGRKILFLAQGSRVQSIMVVKSRWQELEVADHIGSAVRKQGLGGRGGAEHCILGPQPVERYCPQLVCVCSLQLTLSRNFFTDVLKGLLGDFRPCLLTVNINHHINLVYASLLLIYLNGREFF